MIGTFLRFILIMIDKLGNIILLGSPHKTISMRLAFACYCEHVEPRYSWVRPFSRFVDILFHNKYYSLEQNHIYENYEAEEMVSLALWDWYVVIDQEGYDQLESEVLNTRFLGRKELEGDINGNIRPT